MGPTPVPPPQAYGCTPTARSGQKPGKEKKGKKGNGEIKPEHFVVFTDPHATRNTSSGYAAVTRCRGSHLPRVHSSENLISCGLSYCAFLCSTPNDLLCSKVSSWDGKKEPLTPLASKACGELPEQPTQPGMLQATATPLLQKALVYNSKGPVSLPKFPSSYSN